MKGEVLTKMEAPEDEAESDAMFVVPHLGYSGAADEADDLIEKLMLDGDAGVESEISGTESKGMKGKGEKIWDCSMCGAAFVSRRPAAYKSSP